LITGYTEGKSTYTLAKEFCCHKNTVSGILKKNGVTVTNQKAINKLDVEGAIAMYENKCTLQMIADKYKVNPQLVARSLRANGVRIRSGRWEY